LVWLGDETRALVEMLAVSLWSTGLRGHLQPSSIRSDLGELDLFGVEAELLQPGQTLADPRDFFANVDDRCSGELLP
jgi:hypothetical protein